MDEDLDGPATVLVGHDSPRPSKPLPPPTVGRGRALKLTQTGSRPAIPEPMAPAPTPAAPPGGSMGFDDDDDQDIKTMALDALPRPGQAPPTRGPGAPPPTAAAGSMAFDDDDDSDIKTMALDAMPQPGQAPPTGGSAPPVAPAAPLAASGSLGSDDEDPHAIKTMALDALPQGGGAARPAPVAPAGGGESEHDMATMFLDDGPPKQPTGPAPSHTRPATNPPGYGPTGAPRPGTGQFGPAAQWQTGQQPQQPFGTGQTQAKGGQNNQKMLLYILIPLVLAAIGILIVVLLGD